MTTRLLRAMVALALPFVAAMTTSADRDVDRNSPVRKSPPGSTIRLVNPAPAKVPATTQAKPVAKAGQGSPSNAPAAPAATTAPQGQPGVARSIHDWQPGSLNKPVSTSDPKQASAERGAGGGRERAVEIDPKDAPGFP